MTDLHIRWMDEPVPPTSSVFRWTSSDLFRRDVVRRGCAGDVVICPRLQEGRPRSQVTKRSTRSYAANPWHAASGGFDHAEPEEEKEMFALQKELLDRSMRSNQMLEIAIGLGFLLILIPLAAVQTHLEIEEDPRAGSLSIARAFLISLLAAIGLPLRFAYGAEHHACRCSDADLVCAAVVGRRLGSYRSPPSGPKRSTQR